MTSTSQGRSRLVNADHLLSISDASRKGMSAVARSAEQGVPTVLMRGSALVAAVVPVEVYLDWLSRNVSGGTS